MSLGSDGRTPIAIVGIGCRFPGGVVGPATFWRAVTAGIDAIGPIPTGRFDTAAWFDPKPATPGRIASAWGGMLDGIETFDAPLFGISPREAERMDPQQRLLLEVTWEAFEDAAIDPLARPDFRCGVYVGQWTSDYEARLYANPEQVDFHAVQGTGRYSAAGRLSFTFGLRGPSLSIDTACSSSLVAAHLAVQALRTGEIEAAVVCGVNLILQPHVTIAYSQGLMMAPDGRSKFGDAAANGYVRAEGAASIILKRYDQALADGDRIYAVVRGSAINNDGRTSGLFGRPSRAGQAAMLTAALADAALPAEALQFVEAHGTGTPTGDPVELGAIADVVGRGRSAPLWVGSVKTNFGHTEAAAGLAGLIKAALCIRHGAVAPSQHLRHPNPAIDWAAAPLRIPTEAAPLAGEPSDWIGGVSGFGIGGTNAHVILGGVAPRAASPRRDEVLVLPISAHCPEALTALATAIDERLETADEATTASLCALAARRPALAHRAVVVGSGRDEIRAGLRAAAAGEPNPGLLAGHCPMPRTRRLALVFQGQGGQWIGMGRDLLDREPAFRQTIDAADAALARLVDWSLADQIRMAAEDPAWRLGAIDVIQPVLIAVEMAYAATLRAWGVAADAVIGHSVGEAAAAWYAGALTMEDALAVVVHRSRLMRSVAGRGAMAVVELSAEETGARLSGRHGDLAVAVSNASNSTVVSGDPVAVRSLTADLAAAGVFTRDVKVDVASHSPQMDPLVGPLRQALSGLKPRPTAVPFYSTVDAAIRSGADLDPVYWGANLRSTVRFGSTVARMIGDGIDGFIEIGPHPLLGQAVERTAREQGAAPLILATGRRDEPGLRTLPAVLGALFVDGHPVDWRLVYPGPIDDAQLPHLPMIRTRHWIEAALSTGSGPRMVGGARAHPLLARAFDPARGPRRAWETTLTLDSWPWLADHVVGDGILLPAAVMIEGFFAAARELFPSTAWALRSCRLHSAVVLESGRPIRLQWTLSGAESGGRVDLRAADDGDTPDWRLVASGEMVPGPTAPVRTPAQDDAALVPLDEPYQQLAAAGLRYGPAFQLIALSRVGPDAAAVTLGCPAGLDAQNAGQGIGVPPTVVDAALQAIVIAAHGTDGGPIGTPVPTGIGHLVGVPTPVAAGTQLRAIASIQSRTASGFVGSVRVITESGEPVLDATGVEFALTGRDAALAAELFRQVTWESVTLAGMAAPGTPVVVLGSAAETNPLGDELRRRGYPVAIHDSRPGALATTLGALNPAGPPAVVAWCVDSRSGEPAASLLVTVADAGAFASWCAAQGERIAGVRVLTRMATPAAESAVDPAATAVASAMRVLAHEHPSLGVMVVDRAAAPDVRATVDAILAPAVEPLVAVRAAGWLAARLTPGLPASRPDPDADSVAIALPSPGSPDDLRWQRVRRVAPRPDEVEIEVEAAGLNFMNVLSVLGHYPGAPRGVGSLGLEGAGTIVRVGAAVSDRRVAERVAFIGHATMARHATTPAVLTMPAPASLSMAEAATAPIAYVTASYALETLARLAPGETVLIHSAAGGVGLAAIAIARRVGARIFGTAGTPEKRAWLASQGVEAVFDSRSLAWVDDVRRATGGRGVDVVLNSLAGEAQAQGIGLLGPHGRFVEIGKQDIYADRPLSQLGLRRNGAFFAVDLDLMIRERPEMVGAVLARVIERISSGQLPALPTTSFPADQVQAAYRALLPGTHTGKIAVALSPSPTAAVDLPGTRVPIRRDGTYLITGGLGALGLALAGWLADQGAGGVLLLGRRPPTDEAVAAIAAIRRRGTMLEHRAVDVADRAALDVALAEALPLLPRLRGMFHCAGALDDAPVADLTPERWLVPVLPKAAGALHLLAATAGQALDFTVLASSVASALGTPGQANYAAANGVLDGLAADGRCLSLNLGPIADAGLAAVDSGRLRALGNLGFTPIRLADVVAAIERLLIAGVHGPVMVARFDPARWAARFDEAERHFVSRLLGDHAVTTSAGPRTWRQQIEDVPAGRARRTLLEGLLATEAATTLRLPAARIERGQALRNLGMDSLLTLEFRNRVERQSGIRVAAPVLFSHPTITALASYFADQWHLSLDEPEAAAADVPVDVDQLLGALEGLSDDDIRALLADGGLE